jgi:hypothetical protein
VRPHVGVAADPSVSAQREQSGERFVAASPKKLLPAGGRGQVAADSGGCQDLCQSGLGIASENSIHAVIFDARCAEVFVEKVPEAGLHKKSLRVRFRTKFERKIEINMEVIIVPWIVIAQDLGKI